MYKIYGITNKGMIREQNEDCFLVNKTVCTSDEEYSEITDEIIVAVADGMGGAEAGEIASKFILDNIQNYINDFDEAKINEEINILNKKLLDAPKNNIGKLIMGSTLVFFKAVGDENVIVNIGDSRGYLFRDGFIRQITKDQTLVQELSDLGVIGIDEKRNHRESHILTQCLGGGKNSVIKPQIIINRTLKENDILLFCSDGLHNMVDEDKLEDTIGCSNDLNEIGRKLINIANEAGGDDNITIILVKVI